MADFVLKDRLARLVPAIERSQKEAADHAARRIAEQRHRSLFENMLDGYAYCRMFFEDGIAQDFQFIEVNPAFERLTGLKGAAGRNVSELLPEIRRHNPELFERLGRVSLSGQPERFETC